MDFVHSNQFSDEDVSLIIIYKAKSKGRTSQAETALTLNLMLVLNYPSSLVACYTKSFVIGKIEHNIYMEL